MKVTLAVIGKTDPDYLQKGIDEYAKRLGHYVNFEFRVIPLNRKTRNIDEPSDKELIKLFSNRSQGTEIYLLDENGRELSSVEFSGLLEKKMVNGLKELIFVIGGPFGFSDEVRKRAENKLSLSRMTFSHQMVRILFMEQLYRAFTILKGEPYHHI